MSHRSPEQDAAQLCASQHFANHPWSSVLTWICYKSDLISVFVSSDDSVFHKVGERLALGATEGGLPPSYVNHWTLKNQISRPKEQEWTSDSLLGIVLVNSGCQLAYHPGSPV